LGPVVLVDKHKPAWGKLPTLAEILLRCGPLRSNPDSTSDDVACILSTSGTTGKPKEVLLTHNNILFSERSFVTGTHRDQSDVMFMPCPVNHAMGLFHGMISPLILGGRTFLQEHFDAKAAMDLINAEKATWAIGTTPIIYDLLGYVERSGVHPATLNLFLCGGASLPSSMIRRAAKDGVMLCEIYGSSESCPHVYVPPENCLAWDGSWSGIPFKGIEVRVVDENGKDVPTGTQGEEISRGPHMFVGYLNDRQATDSALDDEGWFRSGDLCCKDEYGRIRINGRKKELIIRGGENISPNEIDEALAGCPGISDHATIGMPDERLGERICTFVVPTDGAHPTLPDITRYLSSQHVAKRLFPERIEYIDAIPRTPLGKIKRYALSEEIGKRLVPMGALTH
jgi:acyl-CoA synthetase